MNDTDNARAITTMTVSRTHSLRDPPRHGLRDDPIPIDNGALIKNQRSLSNDKIANDYRPQRGNSLRQTSKTPFSMPSPISNSHHSFQIIKPIDTSPRATEAAIDIDNGKTQKFKFKPRNVNGSQGGPLLIDHGLKMESQADYKSFTPRPPLSKKVSNEQEDGNSDIESSHCGKIFRNFQATKVPVSKPMPSPSRMFSQNQKVNENNCHSSIEKPENNADTLEEYTNGNDEITSLDCDALPPSISGTNRSSLRKNSQSPVNTDLFARNSPSPTKTVKFNPNLSVKNIPHTSTRKDCKSKSRKSKSNPTQIPINLELMEAHDMYLTECTNLVKDQVALVEKFREGKISINIYQKDLIDQIERQKKVISTFHLMLTSGLVICDKGSHNSDF